MTIDEYIRILSFQNNDPNQGPLGINLSGQALDDEQLKPLIAFLNNPEHAHVTRQIIAINLENNKLKNFPCFTKELLVALEEINLRSNKIETIPDLHDFTSNNCSIFLERNPITIASRIMLRAGAVMVTPFPGHDVVAYTFINNANPGRENVILTDSTQWQQSTLSNDILNAHFGPMLQISPQALPSYLRKTGATALLSYNIPAELVLKICEYVAL